MGEEEDATGKFSGEKWGWGRSRWGNERIQRKRQAPLSVGARAHDEFDGELDTSSRRRLPPPAPRRRSVRCTSLRPRFSRRKPNAKKKALVRGLEPQPRRRSGEDGEKGRRRWGLIPGELNRVSEEIGGEHRGNGTGEEDDVASGVWTRGSEIGRAHV